MDQDQSGWGFARRLVGLLLLVLAALAGRLTSEFELSPFQTAELSSTQMLDQYADAGRASGAKQAGSLDAQ